MQIEDVTATELAGSVHIDFSLWGMFAQADFIVQAVMLLLILASMWSWSIIYKTQKRVAFAKRCGDGFEDEFWSGSSLEDLYSRLKEDPYHPMAAVFVTAMREWKRSVRANTQIDKSRIQDRIMRVMHVTTQREMEDLEGQVGYLATIGSSAPFIGLFGTVWGIMTSFQNIALASDTSLATVAPGIAEALLATALGLIAAIPAVIGYNKISTDLGRYAGRIEGFCDEFTAIISRQLDEGASG